MENDSKYCARCGRTIEWRTKWKHCWDEVKYCSKECQRRKLNAVDRAIESEMKVLLDSRGAKKSICPSDVVRSMFPDEDEWRPHIEAARMSARRLVARCEAVIMQKGRVVDPSTAKGPIRIRKVVET